MENSQFEFEMVPQEQNETSKMTFKDIVYLCVSHWYWFVISVILFIGLGVAYILTTPKTYTRSASIVIKEEMKGKSISSDMASAFSDLGLSAPRTNVYNELANIESRDLIRQVVERMNLNIDYSVSGRFHDFTIYDEKLPIKADFPGMDEDEFVTFDVKLSKDGSVKLFNFKNKEGEIAGQTSGKAGYNMLKTPVGRVVITKSQFFSKFKFDQIIHVTRIPMENAKNILSKHFNASLKDKESTVIKLTYNDVVPKRAEDILAAIITIYNENWISDRNQISISTSEFIDSRLQVIEKELGSVDNNISSYKSQHQITDLKSLSSMYLQQSSASDVKVLELNNQIYIAKYIRNYLNNNANKNQLLPANLGIRDNNIEAQISNYNNKLLQRNNIVANSSESNPVAVDLEEQLASLRTAIIHSIDNELMALNTELKAQEGYSQAATSKITSNPQQAKYLLSVERQQKVKENLYLYLLQKREENELSQAFTAYNTRLVERPQGSKLPTAPVSRNILLACILLGLIIPFIILYVKEILNTTVRGKKDLDQKLSMPFLGEIPILTDNLPKKKYQFWKKNKEPRKFVVREGSRGMLNEAFRVIGTNIELMTTKADKDKKVYMLTSYNPGSGKSFISGNLAATLSMKRKKVLAVDADLRHASLSTFVNSPKKGLSEYLRGEISNIADIAVSVEKFPNLDVIPVGTIPPNPTELLSSPSLEEFIQKAREQYDYILIDCPPADMMADASIVETFADRTLFIIRANLFEREMVPVLERDYKNNKFKNMAYILNGSESAGRFGYKYGYKPGYGYGYGKGTKEDFKE